VEWVLGARPDASMDHAVAITFDDGADFDFHDLEHPRWGRQRSFVNIVRDMRCELGMECHATTFVIASPDVRAELDAACMVGRGWMSDDWWATAESSGLVAVQNHSWDHNHPEASRTCQREQRRGSFASIETEPECDGEVAQAARYIARRTGSWPALFAYPNGASSAYLREVYFPLLATRHGTLAAFAADGGHVARGAPRWNLPRFVFGAHWTDPAGLERILRDARLTSARLPRLPKGSG
jgi:peptidoglycan/xylan/chitin deacetylase (PgdA/CDA1 family)